MGRRKLMVTYTVKDHPGLTITVPGKEDSEKTRALALDEVMRMMSEETSEIDSNSFPDGLGAKDLIFVESPKPASNQHLDGSEDLSPIEKAARTVAEFALKRADLQEQQKKASEYIALIEAVFSMTPLTPEQIQLAQDKAFAKTLSSLAAAKVDFDKLLPEAEEAWKLLKPAFADPEPEKKTAATSGKGGNAPVG